MPVKMPCPFCGQPIADVRWYRLPLTSRVCPFSGDGHCCGDFHLPF